MSLGVIGFGVARAGTFSLKLALEELGFGRCHHMELVDARSPEQIAVRVSAAAGKVDWKNLRGLPFGWRLAHRRILPGFGAEIALSSCGSIGNTRVSPQEISLHSRRRPSAVAETRRSRRDHLRCWPSSVDFGSP